jgi:hypothetical protein
MTTSIMVALVFNLPFCGFLRKATIMKSKKLILFTFIGIATPIVIFGFLGVYFSVKNLHHQYVELQLESNSRTAEMIAKLFDRRLSSGDSEVVLLGDFQSAIEGSQSNEGYFCVFDRDSGVLLGHPNPMAVGMDVTSRDFEFSNLAQNQTGLLYDAIATENNESGILKVAGTDRSEIVFMTPVNGTNWKVSVHENIKMADEQLEKLRSAAVTGFIILAIFVSFLSTWIVYKINTFYKREIAEKNREIERQKIQLSVWY